MSDQVKTHVTQEDFIIRVVSEVRESFFHLPFLFLSYSIGKNFGSPLHTHTLAFLVTPLVDYRMTQYKTLTYRHTKGQILKPSLPSCKGSLWVQIMSPNILICNWIT
ncbi:hypothetical protein KIL84_011085 [Mauremys mutica]|uniref:Uncharacterized protein n=1 Tax=Mauremys mutica TaxID=74926 RepID=A0A9D3XDL6_9SAUR|nr:hypothetical protein KIL84_011085 [Mauremys mutica]